MPRTKKKAPTDNKSLIKYRNKSIKKSRERVPQGESFSNYTDELKNPDTIYLLGGKANKTYYHSLKYSYSVGHAQAMKMLDSVLSTCADVTRHKIQTVIQDMINRLQTFYNNNDFVKNDKDLLTAVSEYNQPYGELLGLLTEFKNAGFSLKNVHQTKEQEQIVLKLSKELAKLLSEKETEITNAFNLKEGNSLSQMIDFLNTIDQHTTQGGVVSLPVSLWANAGIVKEYISTLARDSSVAAINGITKEMDRQIKHTGTQSQQYGASDLLLTLEQKGISIDIGISAKLKLDKTYNKEKPSIDAIGTSITPQPLDYYLTSYPHGSYYFNENDMALINYLIVNTSTMGTQAQLTVLSRKIGAILGWEFMAFHVLGEGWNNNNQFIPLIMDTANNVLLTKDILSTLIKNSNDETYKFVTIKDLQAYMNDDKIKKSKKEQVDFFGKKRTQVSRLRRAKQISYKTLYEALYDVIPLLNYPTLTIKSKINLNNINALS